MATVFLRAKNDLFDVFFPSTIIARFLSCASQSINGFRRLILDLACTQCCSISFTVRTLLGISNFDKSGFGQLEVVCTSFVYFSLYSVVRKAQFSFPCRERVVHCRVNCIIIVHNLERKGFCGLCLCKNSYI